MNYKIIKYEDEEYPQKLREIFEPPRELFCAGDITLLKDFSIAIVGCRKASNYGLKSAQIFSNELSKSGICVVSGLALGIDTIAHKYSINNIGKTIAVLGCGLDIAYPMCNQELKNEIINNGGLVITEFPFGTKPLKENFPRRNRIISGLSNGIVVVEAKKRSGTMITVRYALEQGKDIFAVPGNIDSYNSEGTNELIKEGAKMITNVDDILEEYVKL